MNKNLIQKMLIRIFLRLRQVDYKLGLEELFAAINVLKNFWNAGDNEDHLKLLIRILWCKNLTEQTEFEEIWDVFLKHGTDQPSQEYNKK